MKLVRLDGTIPSRFAGDTGFDMTAVRKMAIQSVDAISQLTEDQVESDLDPNQPKIFTDRVVEADVIEVQEEGKAPVTKARVKGVEVELTLEQKIDFYDEAINKDQANIKAAKERIKYNTIRRDKIKRFLKQQAAAAAKLAQQL